MADEYDVFLSHNGADKAAVEEIALRLLDEAGLRPFLDKWELAPGDQWIPALERAIEASKTVAVFFGSAGVGAWQAQEAQLALIRSVREEKRRVIPVLLPGAREASVVGFLRLRSFIDLGEDDGFAKLVAAVGGLSQELLAAFEPGPDVVRWLGVLARVQRELIDFSNERGRHTCFFGREEVLEEMDAWISARDSGWLLVTGSPGLGKSALLDRWLRRRQAAGQRTAFHFIRRGHLDWAEPQVVQRNLAAQIEVMFPEQRDADADPIYRLEQLLGRVSRVLVEQGERLVLLVDGLDEAMTLGKDNPIPYIFPLEVPERVFVITASRPQYPHLAWFDRRNGPSSRLDLDAQVESNERAVREHWSVLGKTMEPPLSDALMRAAVEGARGNLLHAVKLHQLWGATGAERSVDAVPRGLEGMLGELWRRIEELPKEPRKLARMGLSLICAARESLPLRVVGKLLGWDEGDAQADFLPLVREMLLEEPWNEEPAYRPFHERLREVVEEQLVEMLGSHRRMLAEYAAWPVEGDDEFRRGYALRHRIEHRLEAGDADEASKACMDLGFLTAKACAEGVVAVERDIRLAAEARKDDEVRGRLTTLGRLVAASAHWASEVPQALPALLYDRALTNAPELLDDLLGPIGPFEHPRLRHALQGRGMSRIIQGSIAGFSRVWVMLVVLPDGRVVSSNGSSLRVWDVETGRILAVLQGKKTGDVTALAVLAAGRVISGDTLEVWGTRALAAMADGPVTSHPVDPSLRVWNVHTLRVWDVETGRAIATLQGHTDKVRALAVLPDGRVVSGSDDKTLRVWDVHTGRAIATLQGHTDKVRALAVLPDGRVVSGSDDKTLRVWDVETGRALATLEGHIRPVNVLAVLPDGRVVSGSDDRTMRVWDVHTGRAIATLQGHTDFVNALAVLPDGRAVSGSDDKTLRVWDVEAGRALATLNGHTSFVTALAVLPDGRVISGSNDDSLRVWDVHTGHALATLQSHTNWVTALAVLANGRVVSGSGDRTLRVWDVHTGHALTTLQGHMDWVSAVATLPDGRVVSGSYDDTLRIWDAQTGRALATLQGHTDWVNAVAVLPNGRIVSGSNDKTLRVWDVQTGRAIATLRGQTEAVNVVAVLPNGRVVSGSDDGTLRVWDVQTGRAIATLQGHKRKVGALAVSSDGRLVSAGSDKTLQVWDVQTGRALSILQGHTREVNALAMLPDGRVVSGSHDKTLRVWDVHMGRTLATVYGDAAFVAVACVDNHLIVAGDALGNVWFIDLPDLSRA